MLETAGRTLGFLRSFVSSPVQAAPAAPPIPALQPACDSVQAGQPAEPPSVGRDAREPFRLLPEVEKMLLDIGMPPDDSPVYLGRRRGTDAPEEAARKFVVWARAIGATGSYPAGVVCALYAECAAADHRVPVSDNRFLFALKHADGIRRDLNNPDRRRRLWTIVPAEVAKPAAPVQPKVIAKPPLNKPRLFHRYVPDQEFPAHHALVQANAREARRLGRARKQRGSRSRRAA